MGDDIEDTAVKLIQSINALNVEMASFRSEMREFKDTMNRRIDIVESTQRQCQTNPLACSTARRLEEFIKANDSRGRNAISWGGFIISCASLIVVLLKSFVLRG